MSVTKGGTQASNYLDANGNWVWNLQISNSSPIPNGSSPLASELGFTSSTALQGATNLSTGAGVNFDTNNPGSVIFGWETLDPTANNKPTGLQTNT
ncbi:MAG TPA: hypothetical protein VHU84_04075, partial [Lacipirellulaceae bacterium]|nr:hypothetical protein [Lacipirellulaceae bacterium]